MTTGPSPCAVVFDCDGVLVESEAVHARATAEHLAGLGTPVDPAFFAGIVGMRVRDQMTELAAMTGHDADQLFAGREERFWALVDEHVAPVPGVADVVRRLRADRVPLALASSGTRRYLGYVVDRLGLAGCFAAVVSGDDVTHPKPHPETYTAAAAALGCDPGGCLAVDDSPRGVASAVAAGLRVVALDTAGLGVGAFPSGVTVVDTVAALADLLPSRAVRP